MELVANTMPPTTFFEPEHRALAQQVEDFARAKIAPCSGEQIDYLTQAVHLLKRRGKGMTDWTPF